MNPNNYSQSLNEIEDKARVFHAENPHVYELFKGLAIRAAKQRPGITLSAKMIWERMRWEYLFETTETMVDPDTGEPLKLNNNYHAYYARWFMEENPHIGSSFKTRHVDESNEERWDQEALL